MTDSANTERPNVPVVCAVIERDGLVLAAQRSPSMSLPLKWEFPGGKIEPGENQEECLRREIIEELGVNISITGTLPPAQHDYSALTVTLYPFICSIAAGEIQLHEHAAFVWLPPGQLPALDWAEADLPVLAAYCQQRNDEKA